MGRGGAEALSPGHGSLGLGHGPWAQARTLEPGHESWAQARTLEPGHGPLDPGHGPLDPGTDPEPGEWILGTGAGRAVRCHRASVPSPTVKPRIAPPPGRGRAKTVPPCARATSRTMARPSPEPGRLRAPGAR